MTTQRHRVRLDKRPGEFHVYDIKMIDGVDEEVQWGQAVHRPESRKWTITREGTDHVLILKADNIHDVRSQLERTLDSTGDHK